MSCHDAREWLSDLLDDALEAEARAQLDVHLAGCADCRRELERLRTTVSLLRAVERPQAPAGFVDRVLEAARPTPWPRRLLDWLAGVRLLRFPVEAAAMVLVTSLAVYVFQGTPALRQAARPETAKDHAVDSLASSEARTAARDTEQAQTERSAEVQSKSSGLPPPVPSTSPSTRPLAELESGPSQELMKETAEEPATAAKRALPSDDAASREPLPPAPTAPSMPQGAAPTPGGGFRQAAPSESADVGIRSSRKDSASGEVASPSPPLRPGLVPSPEPRESMAREKDQERAERPAPVPIPSSRPPAPSAMRIVPSAHVIGRLAVKDRQAANRELADLVSRVGGVETGRHTAAGGDTVELLIPRAAYPAFAQGLARIGSWLTTTELPELPERVPITLRITQ